MDVRVLTHMDEADLRRCATGYISHSRFALDYADSAERTTLVLRLVQLSEPYVGSASEFDAETLERYDTLARTGWCFGAFDAGLCVGVIIAEAQDWNKSVQVWEFHIADAYRRQGFGRQLMHRVIEKAQRAAMRIVECETQNTNTGAIAAYRRMGFRVEAIDISFYSNDDFPDGEVALFMKRRL